jgi:hypothetical protein
MRASGVPISDCVSPLITVRSQAQHPGKILISTPEHDTPAAPAPASSPTTTWPARSLAHEPARSPERDHGWPYRKVFAPFLVGFAAVGLIVAWSVVSQPVDGFDLAGFAVACVWVGRAG